MSQENPVLDKSTVDQINRLLAQTGERERLKEMLRTKLIECGWADKIQNECFGEIKGKGVDKVSPQELYETMSVKAKENVKREVLQEISRFLESNLP